MNGIADRITHVIKTVILALAWWLSWLEPRLVHQKVGGLIPSQGAYLGCGFDPQLGCILAYRRQPIDVL